MHKSEKEWPNHTNEWRFDSKSFIHSEIEGDILQSKDAIAQSVSADFQHGAEIARGIKRRFATKYTEKKTMVNQALSPQWIPESQRFVFHLITKARYFHKPTYKA